jgi:Sec-independent protein translocase protein TatA
VDIVLVLVVLLIIVLIWRGPKMLPKLGESFGRTVKGVRENLPGVDGDSDDSTSEGDSDPKSGS